MLSIISLITSIHSNSLLTFNISIMTSLIKKKAHVVLSAVRG